MEVTSNPIAAPYVTPLAAHERIEIGASKKDTEILARAVIASAMAEHEAEGVAWQAYACAADAVLAALKKHHLLLTYTSTNSRIDYINL